jgi:TRAP-type C4-dicarboxylate transport system permease small subunit
MFYIAYLGIRYSVSVYELGRVTAALRWPYWIITAALPFGFILGGIEYTRCFIKNVTCKKIYISSHLKLGENMDEGLNNNESLKKVEERKVEV